MNEFWNIYNWQAEALDNHAWIDLGKFEDRKDAEAAIVAYWHGRGRTVEPTDPYRESSQYVFPGTLLGDMIAGIILELCKVEPYPFPITG